MALNNKSDAKPLVLFGQMAKRTSSKFLLAHKRNSLSVFCSEEEDYEKSVEADNYDPTKQVINNKKKSENVFEGQGLSLVGISLAQELEESFNNSEDIQNGGGENGNNKNSVASFSSAETGHALLRRQNERSDASGNGANGTTLGTYRGKEGPWRGVVPGPSLSASLGVEFQMDQLCSSRKSSHMRVSPHPFHSMKWDYEWEEDEAAAGVVTRDDGNLSCRFISSRRALKKS